jgi:hypothetical protein
MRDAKNHDELEALYWGEPPKQLAWMPSWTSDRPNLFEYWEILLQREHWREWGGSGGEGGGFSVPSADGGNPQHRGRAKHFRDRLQRCELLRSLWANHPHRHVHTVISLLYDWIWCRNEQPHLFWEPRTKDPRAAERRAESRQRIRTYGTLAKTVDDLERRVSAISAETLPAGEREQLLRILSGARDRAQAQTFGPTRIEFRVQGEEKPWMVWEPKPRRRGRGAPRGPLHGTLNVSVVLLVEFLRDVTGGHRYWQRAADLLRYFDPEHFPGSYDAENVRGFVHQSCKRYIKPAELELQRENFVQRTAVLTPYPAYLRNE